MSISRCGLICAIAIGAITLSSASCKRDEKSKAAAVSAAGGNDVAQPTGDQCIEQFDLLVPFQKYLDSDLVRSIAVEGDQVYFRNFSEMFQVPLAGGTPRSLAKTNKSIFESQTWINGDRLISQSAGEPIFVAFPKAGGALSTLLDASKGKVGGGRSIATRILSGIGKPAAAHAGPAVFDGTSFFWIEDSKSGHVYSWAIKRMPLAGGPAVSLYESKGELSSLAKAGDHLLFLRDEPEPATGKKATGPKRGGLFDLGLSASDKASIMSLPVAGGAAEVRAARLDGQSIVADTSSVYVSGYQDGSLGKPGVFKISASGGASVEKVFPFHIGQGRGFVTGDRVIVAGQSLLTETKPGNLPDIARVFLAAHGGGKLERFACIGKGYALHAYALAGNTLLVSVFREQDKLAGIARIKVP